MPGLASSCVFSSRPREHAGRSVDTAMTAAMMCSVPRYDPVVSRIRAISSGPNTLAQPHAVTSVHKLAHVLRPEIVRHRCWHRAKTTAITHENDERHDGEKRRGADVRETPEQHNLQEESSMNVTLRVIASESHAQKTRPTAFPMLTMPTMLAAPRAVTPASSWNIGACWEMSVDPG